MLPVRADQLYLNFLGDREALEQPGEVQGLQRVGGGALEPVVGVDFAVLMVMILGMFAVVLVRVEERAFQFLGGELAAGRRWEGAGRMTIATAPPAGGDARYAVLRVSDSGPGIERQYLPRLSERFYRVDQGRGLKPGTGLGLAIVKHVVQRHRGEFVVESEPGRGSAFGVMLPLAAPRNIARNDAPPASDAALDRSA